MGLISEFQVRIQLGQGSAAEVTKNMLKNEGVGAFYKVFFFFLNTLVPIINLYVLSFVLKDGPLKGFGSTVKLVCISDFNFEWQ